MPMLVLFGISQPDLYRTKMWQVGFDNGFNSNPNMILYAYANHGLYRPSRLSGRSRKLSSSRTH